MYDSYKNFRQAVVGYYRMHGRHDLPWRRPDGDGAFDPYKIIVSEIMLQQTQVARVLPKYAAFLARFPTVQALAAASLGEVLLVWQGLGYNRRAKYLWQAARVVASDLGGIFPHELAGLERLPGVGANTAGAILVYAFNEPAVFIETNIRTAYIHHFFQKQTSVPDKSIAELVQKTLDMDAPRVWYWSLMDYGSYLKQTVGNVARASKAYAKQPKFTGSLRQLRGRVLRLLSAGAMDESHLIDELADARAGMALRQLEAEGMVSCANGRCSLP